ncbi:hypothetical protein LPB136_06570 [Tenacibaculum todarodis]|uniref:Glycosyl transferase family 1 domain-containing protein n=1 Tax=Tenacibaculum todarodis TaxID=1850252 RepID=A0A1L3JIS5_9FLAO|nr:hypothetical protein [Tenacibaculum todarodis]APG65041.1 hypothetical protein LPB136_06570 [Tenacibaculum todarodis]
MPKKLSDIDLVLDPINTTGHVYFNTLILKSITTSNTKNIPFICKAAQKQQIEEIYKHNNFKTTEKQTFLLGSFSIFFKMLFKSIFKKKNILLLTIDNTIFPILLILFYPFLFRNNFSIILHNNLQTITKVKSKRVLHKIVNRLYKPNIIVLTKYMFTAYKDVFSLSKVQLLPHPNYKELIRFNLKPQVLKGEKVKIVVLGRQAKLLEKLLLTPGFSKWNNIEFVISLPGSNHKNYSDTITIINKKLSFDEYYSILSLANFCLFANDSSVIERASGILIDCVSLECPVLSPIDGHFKEYKDFNIGFQYKDYKELVSLFNLISEKKTSRLNFKNGFIKAQQYSNPVNNSIITDV